jgi:hypothetical protein
MRQLREVVEWKREVERRKRRCRARQETHGRGESGGRLKDMDPNASNADYLSGGVDRITVGEPCALGVA